MNPLIASEIDIDKLHSLYFKSSFNRGEGQTTKMLFDIIGTLQVVENMTIPVFANKQLIFDIFYKLNDLIRKNTDFKIDNIRGNKLKIYFRNSNNRISLFYSVDEAQQPLRGSECSTFFVDHYFIQSSDSKEIYKLRLLAVRCNSDISTDTYHPISTQLLP